MEKIIAVLLLMLLFALPDLLRRKRRYPSRGKRRSSPMEEQQPSLPQRAQERETETVKPESRQYPEQRHRPKKEPDPSRTTAPAPPVRRPVPPQEPLPQPILPVQELSPAATAAAVEKALPQPQQGEPWDGLVGSARDIYAGLIWSELLQKPLSLRK